MYFDLTGFPPTPEQVEAFHADTLKTTGHRDLRPTFACARCHDQKFDPVSQVDYYE